MSKNLGDLIKNCPLIKDSCPPILITKVSANSAECEPGTLFVATRGALETSKNGHDFIDEAIKNGAVAIIFDEDVPKKSVPMIRASDSKAALSYLCEEFYDRPSHKLKIIGITGTNGKTSTSFMLHSILKEASFNPKIMGTLGIGDPKNLVPLTHTTMDPEFISRALSQMVKDSVTHVIMEISSHALSLKRVEALNFAAVGLTNITQDHLDFHHTIEAYTNAKARLFYELANDHTAIILPQSHPFSFLKERKISFVGEIEELDEKSFYLGPNRLKITLPFAGDFHQKNASLAAAIAKALGVSDEKIIRGLNKTVPIPGRLQWVGDNVVVDFAHTPDALLNLLKGLSKKSKKLILVFGCGGDRDRKKRAIMGKIAQDWAWQIIVTDDNPRSEDPKAIRQEIISGMDKNALVQEIGDRSLAIKTAIKNASKNDIVVIAGKGHENYQIYKTTKNAFSDQLEAEKALDEL